MQTKVRFQGNDYWLITRDGTLDGPIATPEQYANFEVSFAYLSSDGAVLQRGKQIGTREDLEFLGEVTPAERDAAFFAAESSDG